jgi:hypothetical protein
MKAVAGWASLLGLVITMAKDRGPAARSSFDLRTSTPRSSRVCGPGWASLFPVRLNLGKLAMAPLAKLLPEELKGAKVSAVVCSKGRRASLLSLTSLCVLVVAGTVSGCAAFGKGKARDKNARANLVSRDTTIEVEGCKTNSEGAESLDVNGDGKSEIVRVLSRGHEECRTVDLNFDGRLDRTTYFTPRGEIRRVESDFDRDGMVDEIALFEGGRPTETRRATTLDGKLDTWDYFKSGRLSLTERDRNGDGIIDQWWEYPKEGCPLIHIDRDGDGRPDPGASIDYCKSTGETANLEAKSAPISASAKEVTSVKRPEQPPSTSSETSSDPPQEPEGK